MRRKTRIFVWAWGVLLLFAEVSCSAVKTIPVGELFVLPGQIHDKPARFIVDTGSPSTLFALEHADYFGIAKEYQSGVSGGIGGLVPKYAAKIKNWSVAGRRGKESWLELQSMPIANYQGGMSGLIGLDFLEEWGCVLDYSSPNEQKIVFDGSGNLGRKLAVMAEELGWGVLPLVRNPREKYHLAVVEIAGQHQHWIVDSGAQVGLVSYRNAQDLGLIIERSEESIVGSTGNLNHVFQVRELRFALQEGGEVCANLVVINLADLGTVSPESIRYGLVGADTLAALGTIYDVGNAILYFPRVSVEMDHWQWE